MIQIRYSMLVAAAMLAAAPLMAQPPAGAPPAGAPPAGMGGGRGQAVEPSPAQAAAEKFRPPAATLSLPKTPTIAPTAEGFIPRWMILEPIPSNGLADTQVRAAVQKEYFPNQMTVLPKNDDKVTVGGKEYVWHAVDTKLYNVNLYHFAWALRKPTSNVLFWVVTIINAPEEMKNVRLAAGTNAASVWWVNGEEVASLYNDRQTVIDDAVSKRITLKKGQNIVRAAIINAGGATDFCARFLDANDKPLKGYTITLNPAK